MVRRIAYSYLGLKFAGPLTDASKLRYQAVFLMGAGGSGKGYASHKWLKYMPGGGSGGASREVQEGASPRPEAERSLSNLEFEKSLDRIRALGIKVDLDPQGARIPFRLYDYNDRGQEVLIPRDQWKEDLPPDIYREVQNMEQVVFNTPKHEVPSYWRQVNPDLYKEELPGYDPEKPGFVHEMSSEMSKAYFEAVIESGDPMIVDGTGSNIKKMLKWFEEADKAGYSISLVLIIVPLTVNQIRNATRPRNVPPNIVAGQWKKIQENYVKLKSKADVSKVIVNRNDRADIANYKRNKDKINAFIRSETNFDNLFDFIAHHQPSELSDWGDIIAPDNEITDLEGRVDELIQKMPRSDRALRMVKTIRRKVERGRGLKPREHDLLQRLFDRYRV